MLDRVLSTGSKGKHSSDAIANGMGKGQWIHEITRSLESESPSFYQCPKFEILPISTKSDAFRTVLSETFTRLRRLIVIL